MSDTVNRHRPIELDLHASACGMGSCDHADECPTTTVTACEACTFDGVDLDKANAVDPAPWACKHAFGVVQGGRA